MSSSRAVFQITTNVDALVDSFAFAPDCKIASILLTSHKDLVQEVGTTACRIVAVDGEPVSDSGDLKERLLKKVANGGDGHLTATFKRTDVHTDRIPIERSVVANGKLSEITAPRPGEVDALLAANAPPPAASPQEVARANAELPGVPNSIDHPYVDLASLRANPAAVSALAARMPTPPPPFPPRDAYGEAMNSTSAHRSASMSDVSSLEFNTVKLSPKDTALANAQAAPPSSVHTNTSSVPAAPPLLEFEQMRLSIRDDGRSFLGLNAMALSEETIRGRLRRALENTKVGHAVICVTQDVNPIAELELLAMSSGRRLVAIDLSLKLRLRPKPDVLAAQFAEAMRSGAWFALINAHKSINSCRLIDELLQDARERNFQGFDEKSRVLFSLEPHPHFPRRIISSAVVIRLTSQFEGSSILSDSMATSQSRNRLVTADALSASHLGAAVERALTGSMAAVEPVPKRRVRINAAVDIVDIAPREVVKAQRRDCPIDVSGSVALVKTFTGIANDKFLCVRSAGEPGRFAVGSSFGNVYFLDSLGNSLLQAHAHNSSIWDVSFADKLHFATGCEDGTSASWTLSADGGGGGGGMGGDGIADTTLVPTSATSLGADVYCVSYLKNQTPSPLLIGGLHNNLVIRTGDSDAVQLVPIPSNGQVIDCLPNAPVALVGGGDGSVCVVDVSQGAAFGNLTEHTRKLPALTVRDDNQFFTGSFDSSILSWDLRVPQGLVGVVGGAGTPVDASGNVVTAHTVHTLKLKNYVTGLDVDDVHLAASVGENLYLWDVRKLNTVLGGYPQGWKGLSRGIKVESASHLVVTASPDGNVRFWSFV